MKKFQDTWLTQINSIIDDNLSNSNFQISDVIDVLKISRAKLYRDMVKLTGMSPRKYIVKRRLDKAKALLEVGLYPSVKETSVNVGFRNHNYFTRLFSKEFGVLPSKLLREEMG